MELRDSSIRSIEDYEKIKYKNEREVAEFLQELNPQIDLYYERQEYTISKTQKNSINLSKRSTLPDFEAEDPTTGQRIIIEVTECKSPKIKNKNRKIMALAEPDIPYIVFTRRELYAIRHRHSTKGHVIFDNSENLRLVQQLLAPTSFAAD